MVPRIKGMKLTEQEVATTFADPDWSKKFPPILSIDQAVDLLQIPKDTIYNWSSRGLLTDAAENSASTSDSFAIV